MFRFLASLTFSCLCAFAAGQGQEHGGYFMETQTHDIVMVVGRWTCSSDLTLGALVKHLKVPIGLMYVIGPPPVVEACSAVQATYTNLLCVPEDHILPASVVPTVNALNFKFDQSRRGWYYHQMLKLLAVHALPLRAHYLIWDAGAVLIRDYSPYLNGAMRLITADHAYKGLYSAATEELVHVKDQSRNVVVHQAAVVRSVMKNMLRYICGDAKGQKCASIILNRIPPGSSSAFAMAEYHTYTMYQDNAYEGAYMETEESFERDTKKNSADGESSCEERLAASTNRARSSSVVKYYVVFGVHSGASPESHKVIKHVANEFDKIYSTNKWGSKESKSGAGSTLQITETARNCIGDWIQKYDFKNFGDICGDANWQRFIPNIGRVNYTGFDVSEIALVRAKGTNPSFNFQQLDMARNPPPHGRDVFMVRDVVQHLPAYMGINLYRNLILSGVRYLITSTYPKGQNRNIEIGDYYLNNIYNPPFDMLQFPKPLESCWNYDDNDRRGSRLVLVKLPFFFEPKVDTEVCSKVHTFVEKSVKKSICLDKIVPGSCVVYSFGINYQWEFDDFMHSYGCTVHSFDPGMTYKDKRAENHFFHKVGLGNHTGEHTGPSTLYNQGIKYSVATVQSLMKKLGHNYVDLVRLDVEGAEWDVLDFLPYHQFGQLSLEVHLWKESYEFYLLKMENIPMKSWATYQNVDRVNKMTMTEVIPGVTRVYELAFLW